MRLKSSTLWIMSFVLYLPWLASAELASITTNLQPMPEQRSFNGRIEAIHQATVSAETRGRIAEINADIGDLITAGTVILTITSTEQRASLTQAEANLAEAKSNLVAETAEYNRIKDLFSRDFVAKSEMDKANARLSAVSAKVNSAAAALNTAKEQMSYTEVKAPFNGIVSARYVEPGELVQPGTLLMSGYDPNALRVEVDIPQNIAEKVREYGIASVIPSNSDDINDAITPSKLILYPTADFATSTVRVRLELSQHPEAFHPGEFVKVLFTIGETKRLLIPASSVVYHSEVTGVYVLQKGKPALRQIRPGAIFSNQLEVLAGLSAGEIVATDSVAAAIELTSTRAKKGDSNLDH
ncbi:efflux RND transporter periplasmic adaptor subunit [Thalassotalea piscium]